MQVQSITIQNKINQWIIESGKPYLIRWKGKNKQREGVNLAIGWIIPGENNHTVKIIHSTFATWDKVETQYTSSWTVFHSQILEIKRLKI